MEHPQLLSVASFSTNQATVLEGDKLISATSDNKDLLTSKLEDVSAVGASNFEEAFEVAFQLLETSRADAASSSQCSSAIIMLSDSGEGEDDQELRTFVQSKNENISAQIFTFALAGNDSSPVSGIYPQWSVSLSKQVAGEGLNSTQALRGEVLIVEGINAVGWRYWEWQRV